ncbi:hypothetical protein BZA70DRAFT_274456 [Myxozyma melibiosi]|uniref:SYO1-like TPR repeats domain-containing protein n=1 Tax=Myxozyma melibiosi TaxID=54550 RepID=A0ABR1F9U1_9ASCO
MAKSKKVSRNSLVRVSALKGGPTTAVKAKAAENVETALPLLQKLTSSDAKERAMAASAISSLLEIPTVRKVLLKEKLVKILIERSLTDSSEEVVTEAFGALRNLALEEGYDVCVFIWRKDILASIEIYLSKIQASLSTIGSLPAAEKKQMFVLLENILSLLTSLSGASDEIRDSIANRFPELLVFDLSLIDGTAIPESVKTLAAENLYALTEQNPSYNESIQNSGFIPGDSLSHLVNMYIAGVQFNIFETSTTSSIDILDIVTSVYKLLAQIDIKSALANARSESEKDVVEFPSPANDKTTAAQNDIITVQLGLELLTVVSEALVHRDSAHLKKYEGREEAGDAEDEILEDVDGEIEDDVPEIEESGSEDNEMTDHAAPSQKKLDNPTAALLLERVFSLVASLSDFDELRSRALNALNNMSWTLNTLCESYLPWTEMAREHFLQFAATLRDVNHLDIESRCGLAGALWACAAQCKGDIPLELSDARWLLKQYQELEGGEGSLECRVRFVGLFGVLAQAQGRAEVTKEFSVFLLTQIKALPNKEPEIVIESLNALFDIFADKNFDYDAEVFVKGDFLKHLASVQDQVKQMAKRIDKRKENILRTRADEAVHNLIRFIAYKAREQRRR